MKDEDKFSTFVISKRSERIVWPKYAKTVVLVFSWVCLGLYSEILGPTLPTLMHQTGANYREIGTALSIRSVGLLTGSLIGGWASDRWAYARGFQMTLALLLAALTNVLIPLARSIPLISFILFLAGCSHGYLTTNGNPLLGAIWESKASGPFSLMHAGYGIGGAVAPMLVAPFTIQNSTNNNASVATTQDKLAELLTSTNGTDKVLIEPIIPYNVVAGILFICAVCFIPFCGLKSCPTSRRSPSQRRSTLVHNTTETQVTKPHQNFLNGCPSRIQRTTNLLLTKIQQNSSTFCGKSNRKVIFLFLATFIIYFAVVGNERVFGKFMFTYAIEGPILMSPQNAYFLNLLYWICFGLARVLTFFLSMCIPANPMVILVVIGTIVVSVGLTLIPSTEPWFFAFTCLFSLFKSPLFPTILAAINQSHEITGMLVVVVNLGSACGASLLQFAAGSLIENYGQHIFPYLVCGSAVVVLITSTALLILLRVMGNRFDRYDYPVESTDIAFDGDTVNKFIVSDS